MQVQKINAPPSPCSAGGCIPAPASASSQREAVPHPFHVFPPTAPHFLHREKCRQRLRIASGVSISVSASIVTNRRPSAPCGSALLEPRGFPQSSPDEEICNTVRFCRIAFCSSSSVPRPPASVRPPQPPWILKKPKSDSARIVPSADHVASFFGGAGISTVHPRGRGSGVSARIRPQIFFR